MRVWFRLFGIQLRRVLRRPSLWVLALLLPAFVLGAGLLPDGMDGAVTVGVLAPDTPRAAALVAALAETGGDVHFVAAADEDELHARVAASTWECGYILDADFDSRLVAGNTRRIFTRVVSPATSMDAIVDEMVTAALFRQVAPDMAAAVLENSGMAEAEARLAVEAFAGYRPMQPQWQGVAGESVPRAGAARMGLDALLRGGIALLALVAAAACALWLWRDKESGFYTLAAPYGGAGIGSGACLAATALPLLCGLLLAGALAGESLALLLLYTVYVAGWCLLLCALLPSPAALLGLLAFVVPASLLLSPIFVDVTVLLPRLVPLSWLLPPTLYLRAAGGRLPAVLLPVLGLALAGMGFLLLRIKRVYKGRRAR